MLLVVLPLLLLSLPTLLQVGFTFRHLRHHSASYLWTVFLLALVGQVMAGVAAKMVSHLLSPEATVKNMDGFGSGIFIIDSLLLAAFVTPGLALLAMVMRWWQSSTIPQ